MSAPSPSDPRAGPDASARRGEDSAGGYLVFRRNSGNTIIDGVDQNMPSHIIIPEGVVEIKDEAFAGKMVERIEFPASIRRIGVSCFACCKELKSVRFSEGIESICSSVFARCSSLVEISLPKTMRVIEDSAFSGCLSLKSIDLPTEIESIGKNAFSHCMSLRGITIPPKVSAIKYGTFYGCESLGSIEMHENVRSFEEDAFFKCPLLSQVVVPSNVTVIPSKAFKSCKSLKTIYLPNSVESIGDNAFEGCSLLDEISIPDKVRVIKNGTFMDCKSLKIVRLSENIEIIEDVAFSGCTSLQEITYSEDSSRKCGIRQKKIEPMKVGKLFRRIGNFAFRECPSLARVSFPPRLGRIDSSSFFGCNLLKSIILPKKVLMISYDTFLGGPMRLCLAFRQYSLFFDDSVKMVTGVCDGFYGKLEIPEGVISIGKNAFKNSRITSIKLPKSLKYIEDSAFSYCNELEVIDCPPHLESIGERAFYCCHNLDEFHNITKKVRRIGEFAFCGCRQLKQVRLPEKAYLDGDKRVGYHVPYINVSVTR